MANSSWSLLAGGAALGVAAGFVLALQWSDRSALPPAATAPAAVPAGPNPEVVKALEAQSARIARLERDVERLSGTVRDLTQALREATAGRGSPAAAPSDATLPWLPAGGLNVAKAWYAERIAAAIQRLAAKAESPGATAEQQRAWAEQGQAQGDQLTALRDVTTVAQFAAWLQRTGHGEEVPSQQELADTARRLAEPPK